MKLVFATNNQHKLKEIRHATGKSFTVLGLNDIDIREDIPETCDTLEGNAIQKATYITERYSLNCFADDTGLEVEALNGAPGVYSARYAGEGCSFEDNVRKLLAEMKGVENRRACFRTVIAFSHDSQIVTFEGRIEGIITTEGRGKDGFGYDPVFQPEGFQQTFAEMPLDLKNSISHRGRAVAAFTRFLEENFTSGNQ